MHTLDTVLAIALGISIGVNILLYVLVRYHGVILPW